MRNNKGVTLVSLVIYIAVVMVVVATVIRITTYFKNNMADVADVSFEKEFQKINLYLLEESKTIGNEIEQINDSTEIIFTNGNKYTYIASEKIVYLNDTIKICENVEFCTFGKKTSENGKNVITLDIKINKTVKIAEYVMVTKSQEIEKAELKDYLWGASLVTYHLEVGDYVAYTPDVGTYKVVDGQNGTGYTTKQGYQSFTTETGENALPWRVLSIDDQTGMIELIPEISAQNGSRLYLKGAAGYNHGVDILNDLCEALYSKTVNGEKIAIARSINSDDINKNTTCDYTDSVLNNTKYGKTTLLSSYPKAYRYYPSIYIKEETCLIDGERLEVLNESEGLQDGDENESGVTEYTTVTGTINDSDAETNNNVMVTHTAYEYSVGTYRKIPARLINKTDQSYWVASRSVALLDTSTIAYYYLRYVNGNGAFIQLVLYRSNNIEVEGVSSVKPIVLLDAIQWLDFSVGDGSKENPWGMK